MNGLDFVIIAILGYNLFYGLKQGAIKMISGLVAIFVSIICSKQVYHIVYDNFGSSIELFKTYPFILYGISFVLILLALQLIANILHNVFKWTGVGIFNHIFGLMLGLVKGILLALILIIPLVLIDSSFAKNSLIVFDTKPFIDILIMEISNAEFFSNLFETVNLPDSPFNSDKLKGATDLL